MERGHSCPPERVAQASCGQKCPRSTGRIILRFGPADLRFLGSKPPRPWVLSKRRGSG
jgi:hypothetical protein